MIFLNEYIILSSITYATKAKKLLKREGYTVIIMKTPSDLGYRGCSYSIQVKKQDSHFISDWLPSVGIKVLGVIEADQ